MYSPNNKRNNNNNNSNADPQLTFKYVKRPQTNLISVNISDPLEASEVFGTKVGNDTPIVCIPGKTNCSLWTAIPQGSAAIVTRYGKYMGIYPPGWHWFPAWYNVQYMVNTQHIPYHFHVKQCPTKDNVQIKVHVDVLFHITDPHAFVYEIGPEKLEELLRASQAESVRSLVRNCKISEAYDLRGEESQDMVASLNDKLKQYGVEVKQVVIANVQLPVGIVMNMQSETTFEAKQTEQRKKQQFELKVLNDNNYLLKVKLDRENERKKATQESIRLRSLITQEVQQVEANYERLFADIKASQNYETSKILADCRLEARKTQAEQERIILETKAKGEKEVGNLIAETEKYVRSARAQAQVVVAENKAKALEILGAAEANAAKKLKFKRQYEIDMESIKVWGEMAKNQNVYISGDSGVNTPVGQLYGLSQLTQALAHNVQGTRVK